VTFRAWLIKCCDKFVVVVIDRLGMKKMLRFSGMPGVGARIKPAYKAEDMPCDGLASRERPCASNWSVRKLWALNAAR